MKRVRRKGKNKKEEKKKKERKLMVARSLQRQPWLRPPSWQAEDFLAKVMAVAGRLLA